LKKPEKPEFLSSRVRYLSLDDIRPQPQQPRKHFPPEDLQALAQSIREHGILQPLTVRAVPRGYELIAGERRLRAAHLAGLRQVPCLIARVGEEDAALLALIEQLQRRDLDCWEAAEAIARLMRQYGMSQEEAADKIGKSQSGVANKLRLLRLPESVRQAVRRGGMTERHARALLRLEDEEEQLRVASLAGKEAWTVAQTERYIEDLLRELQTTPPRHRPSCAAKDVRLFLNGMERGVRLLQRAGVEAVWDRQETDHQILLTVRIPKTGEAL